MSIYKNVFSSHIGNIISEKRYRDFLNLTRIATKIPYATHHHTNKEITVWCSNDYLGMSSHPKVIEAAQKSLLIHGVGSGGTRNISGNNSAIVRLEQKVAELHNKDKALIFTSGYVANDAALSTIAKIIPGIVFLSDELNHASIIAGITRARAEKYIYKHLDMEHLESLLQKIDINAPKIIVFESAYSMDGLFSPIAQICKLAKKYNALTFIDEVHTVGLYGQCGAGVANMLGLDSKIDIIQGTLAKTYGAIGGYIAARNDIIDAIRLSAPGFIFTTSLPPLIADAAIASITHLSGSDLERKFHREVIQKVKTSFDNSGIKYLKNHSHIIPIIIGDPVKAKELSKILLEKYDIYIQHINFPTVPKGTERVRITPTPSHTDEMIDKLTKALVATFKILEIKQQAA